MFHQFFSLIHGILFLLLFLLIQLECNSRALLSIIVVLVKAFYAFADPCKFHSLQECQKYNKYSPMPCLVCGACSHVYSSTLKQFFFFARNLILLLFFLYLKQAS